MCSLSDLRIQRLADTTRSCVSLVARILQVPRPTPSRGSTMETLQPLSGGFHAVTEQIGEGALRRTLQVHLAKAMARPFPAPQNGAVTQPCGTSTRIPVGRTTAVVPPANGPALFGNVHAAPTCMWPKARPLNLVVLSWMGQYFSYY